jgi:hypothetical protein
MAGRHTKKEDRTRAPNKKITRKPKDFRVTSFGVSCRLIYIIVQEGIVGTQLCVVVAVSPY